VKMTQKRVYRGIGKRQWQPEPEFAPQFRDGRGHITCPKCRASLGDGRVEKGKWDWYPVSNFRRQFMDRRDNITCPRCQILLGKMVWIPPTTWDWIEHFFSGNMGWKGRAIASLAAGVSAMLVFGGYCLYCIFFENAPIGPNQSFWYLLVVGLPVSLMTYLIIRPCAMDRWGHYPWWLYQK
jgi:hypothetical protein